MNGTSVWMRAWQAQVGRCSLYLLDTGDPANSPVDQAITSELYGGDPELRLKQEIVLGIGGWRLLSALGIKPEVCHLNEGHASFALLERARAFMLATGREFEVSLAATRAGNLFTTHTAVAAGFDIFSPGLIERFLGGYAGDLKISIGDLMALGRRDPRDANEPFNMAYLAFRGSGSVNGVSRLHGCVSRKIFASLFPQWPECDVPVGHVTNGVHMPTWDSAAADAIWTSACGKGRWNGESCTLEADIRRVSDKDLWALRVASRKKLVEYASERFILQMAANGKEREASARGRLSPGVLTLGFARRFATYKRPNLLLKDPARLMRILRNPERPAQLILAGKAHPADKAGQELIRQWMTFICGTGDVPPVVFLADYDMLMAEHLVQGVDVWINTPQRPWEASGTSGMKVLVNGGLNLSELDGWWAEAYSQGIGWAIGDGKEHTNDPEWDAVEADTLYSRLEFEVIPEFYKRDAGGIPVAWVSRIRESMAQLTPRFSASRTVREYTDQHYIPSAINFQVRAAQKGSGAQNLVEWQNSVSPKWPGLRFETLEAATEGSTRTIKAGATLGNLDPDDVMVELFADGLDGNGAERMEMTRQGRSEGGSSGYIYSATVPSARAASDYTARLMPRRKGMSVPLEASEILWQK
jgi:starch phosphorylase